MVKKFHVFDIKNSFGSDLIFVDRKRAAIRNEAENIGATKTKPENDRVTVLETSPAIPKQPKTETVNQGKM